MEQLVSSAQVAATLDTLERLSQVPLISSIVLSTNDRDLGQQAAVRGAIVELDPPGGTFHFGDRLASLLSKYRPRHPLYIGGGAGILMRSQDWQGVAIKALSQPGAVITNNLYSCDFAAWSPGDAFDRIRTPELDNDLAFRLNQQAGLEVLVLDKNASTQLDLDTPSDLITASFHPQIGSRLQSLLVKSQLDSSRANRIREQMADPRANLIIAGRVSASMMLFLEKRTRCQWRVYCEERGMRASGRQERGQVHSFLGSYLDLAGPNAFFSTLSAMADGILMDTRVLFAHRGLAPSAPERFNSDLLRAEEIEDPFIRAFTAAARDSAIPVLMGGHSLVSGGTFALAEAAGI